MPAGSGWVEGNIVTMVAEYEHFRLNCCHHYSLHMNHSFAFGSIRHHVHVHVHKFGVSCKVAYELVDAIRVC